MQSWAILVDSIRALRSRYLFWISFAISLLVVLSLFGTISFTETGWRILWFEPTESEIYRAGSEDARDLLAWLFNSIYVRWWLSWAAIALALISTASIIPDFLAAGAVELSLSKPISRLKMIALKVVGALMFVALQVTAGVTMAWLLIGAKVGTWLAAAFWAIPLITLQFFYLYAIAALIAVLTRSMLASLLVTLIAWAMFSTVQFASNQLDSNIAQLDTSVAHLRGRIARVEDRAEAEQRELLPDESERIVGYQDQLDGFEVVVTKLRPWRKWMRGVELVVPKTADIQKILANKTNAPVLNELLYGSQGALQQASGVTDPEQFKMMMEAGSAGQHAIRQVDATRSILSSLALPMIAMLAAGVVFLRRDY